MKNPGNVKFLCNRRLSLGPQPKHLMLTFVAKITIFIMYISVVVPNHPASFFLYIGMPCLMIMVYLLLKTTLTDPGIIPSCISDEECANLRLNSSLFGSSPQDSVALRYCSTCNIPKPPRSKHCKDCNVCINRMDHHCPFTGSCIGIRNYRYFFLYIVTSCFSNWFIFILTFIDLEDVFSSAEGGINAILDYAFREKPVHTIIFVFSITMIVFLTALVCFHFYLLFTRQTTNEAWKRFGLIPSISQNVYQNTNEHSSLSFLDHLKDIFWDPLPPSYFYHDTESFFFKAK